MLGLPISSKLPPVFGPSCMRQKLIPRTIRRPSPTPAVRVRLRSTNTKKIQFTQRLPLGSELHMGKERCCFRGLDHLHGPTFHSIYGNLMIYKPSLTSDRLMFEHDESLRAALAASRSDETRRPGRINKQREGLLPSTEGQGLSHSYLKKSKRAVPSIVASPSSSLGQVDELLDNSR
ncbi:hypothetical protein RND71_036938 [Anisodus tanguticus]|uniref:Uncharacterized protein n=1 Tax=Anisodus tanguticus TaxID=243964 RepID=A0AAE1R1E3_9SOLA|nr:hypothetical protein RND71_036938 [Anisodus tanguticus]